MTTTTDFVSKLMRAANEVGRLTSVEKQRLLDRAVATILDLREQVAVGGNDVEADAVLNIQVTALSLGVRTRSNEQVKTSLLEAAGMIRILKIVLDAREEVHGRGPTH